MQTITTPLPREKIGEIKIYENGEPLVTIPESKKLVLLHEHKYLSPLLRTSVRDRLVQGANSLPEGYKLLVVTAYRPITMQQELYRNRLWQMAKAYPFQMIFLHWKWKRMVRQYTAPPGGSSHQCGAAVDVTILDIENKRLDMGTSFNDFGEKVHTHSTLISDEQKKNRAMLFELMTNVGFANYPLEWWHYSYGDRMWAAYNEKERCFYGPLYEK
ncbi:D-alanyl-D-alanine carboxypeptidase family protein [Candidatus Nomurabacteria bacterium]|nr:D-alanyl-D-alanine carboxypeptidase family protein [Candidatus Nomurabacteria bacterium]